MTHADTLVTEPEARPQVPFAAPADGSRSAATDVAGGTLAADQPETGAHNPWQGIPAELLDGTYSYDLDSAGGCG